MRTSVLTALAAGLLGGIALGLAAAGPTALAQDAWTGTDSAEDLRYRLDILDAELADIRARLDGAPESSSSAGASGAVSESRLTELEGEIRRLTAMVEEMQNRQRRIAQEAARRFSDIEFRLTELEGGDIGSVQPVQPLGGVDTGPGDGDRAPASGGTGSERAPDSGSESARAAAVSVSERGDLDRAIQDVRQGRFDQAEDRLRRFLDDYPASPLTGQAWYWLGESQVVRGIHAEAARSFLNGYNADRSGPQAPHNLYRLGVALGRLGQINEACLTLREVLTQFPDAPDGLVGKADAEADQLNCG